jgi:very-short-patch-repair endonuclease
MITNQPPIQTGEVLVVILNDLHDFALARDRHWYRIPISSAEKWVKHRWPPRWIAFYHTKIFGELAFGVHFYARVIDVRKAYRWQLFPDQPQDERSQRIYYQLMLDGLQPLPLPIFSRRWRRIVFIPTTWQKLITAAEINDLYDESPLEDRLWAEFKRAGIDAQRQEFVAVKQQDYALDFAVYCRRGKLDVETDGDAWHANPQRAAGDNVRDNALKTVGWRVLRFNTPQIMESAGEYCISTVAENIDRLGGLDDGRVIPRRFGTGEGQMSLFDD